MQMTLRQTLSTPGGTRHGQRVVAVAGPVSRFVAGADEESGEPKLCRGSKCHEGEKEGMVVGPHCASTLSHIGGWGHGRARGLV